MERLVSLNAIEVNGFAAISLFNTIETNGFAASPIGVGSKIDNPIMQLNVPRITTGNV